MIVINVPISAGIHLVLLKSVSIMCGRAQNAQLGMGPSKMGHAKKQTVCKCTFLFQLSPFLAFGVWGAACLHYQQCSCYSYTR